MVSRRSAVVDDGKTIKVDLKALSLPGPGAAVSFAARPLISGEDRANSIRELLAVKIPQAQVDELLSMIEVESSVRDTVNAWPTAGEDKEVLLAGAALTEGLAKVLRGASPKAGAEIATAEHLAAVRCPSPKDLVALARSLRARANKIEQTRRAAWLELVIALDRVVGRFLPAPSKSPSSRYYRACKATFVLAGCYTSPDKAIEAFQELREASGRKGAEPALHSALSRNKWRLKTQPCSTDRSPPTWK